MAKALKPRPRAKTSAALKKKRAVQKPSIAGQSLARAKPRPKALASRKPASSILSNMFSTSHAAPAPVGIACGDAFPYHGLIRQDAALTIVERYLLVVANTGRAGTVAELVRLTAVPTHTLYTVSTLALADDAGGPTSGRAMKLSLTMVNSTQLLAMGGRVTVLNAKQRVALPAAPNVMTLAQYNTFLNEIRQHPDSQSYSGVDFREPQMFTAHPVDDEFTHFEEWIGTMSVDGLADHYAVWPGGVPQPRRMSTIFVVFEVPAAPQDYTFTIRPSFYTRWPLSTVPGQAQKPIPTAPLQLINQHVVQASALGKYAVQVSNPRVFTQ